MTHWCNYKDTLYWWCYAKTREIIMLFIRRAINHPDVYDVLDDHTVITMSHRATHRHAYIFNPIYVRKQTLTWVAHVHCDFKYSIFMTRDHETEPFPRIPTIVFLHAHILQLPLTTLRTSLENNYLPIKPV